MEIHRKVRTLHLCIFNKILIKQQSLKIHIVWWLLRGLECGGEWHKTFTVLSTVEGVIYCPPQLQKLHIMLQCSSHENITVYM